MKGVVKFKDGKDGWEIRDIERRDPGPGDIEIKVMNAGICGSELHLFHDNHYYTPGTVIGHEYSGCISRVGEGVTGWKVGDRVITENHFFACGSCFFCRTGNTVMCPTRGGIGYHKNGGWAEYVIAPTKYLIKIPDSVTYEQAACVEPLAVLTEALTVKEPIQAGEVVLVEGCGAMGLLAAQTAKAAGAGTVIITGTDLDEEIRFPIARSLPSIDYVVNIQKEDVLTLVSDLTGGLGADTVVECSGAPAAVTMAMKAVRRLGRIIAVGEMPVKDVPVDWNQGVFKAVNLRFTFGSNYLAWHRAVKMIEQGSVNVDAIITHHIDMSDFLHGFELLDSKKAVKVMMKAF